MFSKWKYERLIHWGINYNNAITASVSLHRHLLEEVNIYNSSFFKFLTVAMAPLQVFAPKSRVVRFQDQQY